MKFLAKHYLVTLFKLEIVQNQCYQMYSSQKLPKITNLELILAVFFKFLAKSYLVSLQTRTIPSFGETMSGHHGAPSGWAAP